MGEKPHNSKLLREFSAGGVVFKKKDGNILWLVTESRPSELYPKGFWRLPKGWLDDDEDGKLPGPLASGKKRATEQRLQRGALKEVREEGGIEAKIISKIGTIKLFSKSPRGKVLKFTTFYLMEWMRDLSEGPGFETSEVVWLPFEDARKKITYSSEKKVLDKAKETLERGLQQNLI